MKNIYKYIFILLFFIQIIILIISVLLLLNILHTNTFFITANTFSLSLRLIVYIPFLIILYRFLLKKAVSKENRYSILILLLFPIILDALGEILGWYYLDRIILDIQYDDILHFLSPIFLTISLSILFNSLLKIKTFTNILTLTSLSFLICIWEIYEYWNDYFFKTTMSPNLHDTILDMTLGIIGGVFAILFLKVNKKP